MPEGVMVEALLGLLVSASAAFYFLSSLSLFTLHRVVGEEAFLRLTLSFALLGTGQVLMLLSLLSSEDLSFALYTSSTAFAVSGYLSMIRARQALALLSPLILIPSGIDMLASLSSSYVSYTSHGFVRAAFLLLAISHLGRSVGPLAADLRLLPGLEISMLIWAEFLRALAALILAVRYRKLI
ncbi:MAG: hypothetical protein NZ902_04535 [Acidilobaceae archaeon]|nr:hypothetical protein [Acidilobaceae archaeon]MDW7974480.1 hypothetical protein [Sulfolobales archaeon]